MPNKTPDQMTVVELRAALEPYGTPYRLSMSKRKLIEALSRILENERRFGQPQVPFGHFDDEHQEKQ